MDSTKTRDKIKKKEKIEDGSEALAEKRGIGNLQDGDEGRFKDVGCAYGVDPDR